MNLGAGEVAISLGTSDTVFLSLEEGTGGLLGHVLCNPVDSSLFMGLIWYDGISFINYCTKRVYWIYLFIKTHLSIAVFISLIIFTEIVMFNCHRDVCVCMVKTEVLKPKWYFVKLMHSRSKLQYIKALDWEPFFRGLYYIVVVTLENKTLFCITLIGPIGLFSTYWQIRHTLRELSLTNSLTFGGLSDCRNK